MEEQKEEVYNGIGGDHEDEEIMEKEEENNNGRIADSTTSFLELNMVMLIASLTLSNQDLSKNEDIEKLNHAKEEGLIKSSVSKFRGTRKRDLHELTISDNRRGSARLQPKILDSRHGRKM